MYSEIKAITLAVFDLANIEEKHRFFQDEKNSKRRTKQKLRDRKWFTVIYIFFHSFRMKSRVCSQLYFSFSCR